MLIYLHGFRSAPVSVKARLLAERMRQRALADRFWCEQLPVSPRQAVQLVESVIADSAIRPTLVGSSLGGFYATYLAEKLDLSAVLINPAVVAHLSLARYLGSQTNLYTDQTFEFTRQHIAELKDLEVPQLRRPERFWLLVETGDEVLDYRHAVDKYARGRQTVIHGGDHSFRQFPAFLDAIIDVACGPAHGTKRAV